MKPARGHRNRSTARRSPITVDVSGSSVRPRISHVCRSRHASRQLRDPVACGNHLCDERVRLAQVCRRYGSKATEHAFYCGLNCLSHKTPWAPSVPIDVRHGCTPPSTSGHRCTKNYATSPLLASRRRCIRRKSHDGPGWRRPGNAWLILPIVFLAIRVLSTQGDLRSLPFTHLSRREGGNSTRPVCFYVVAT